jgi:hypothetical protein
MPTGWVMPVWSSASPARVRRGVAPVHSAQPAFMIGVGTIRAVSAN